MPVVIATAILGAGASALAIAITAAVISVGLSYLSKTLFSPSGGQAAEENEVPEQADQGILANKTSNNAPVPLIYGYRKVGGSKIFQNCTNDNKDFWMVLVLGEGEIEGIQKFYVDDSEVTLSSLNANTHLTTTKSFDSVAVNTITSGTEYKVTAISSTDWSSAGGPSPASIGDVFTATANRTSGQLNSLGNAAEIKSRYTGHCEFYYKTGTNGQSAITASDFNNDPYFPTNWDSDKRLSGLAYVMCKFVYDKEVFRGMPTITMDVKGIKVPDLLNNVNNKVWSRNPAAIMYDYLTNTVYGRGLLPAQMDLATFQAAYNHCETPLAISGTPPPKSIEGILGSSEQKLYRLDGIVNVDENTFNNTKKILSTCRAFLIFSAGKYQMVCDKFENAYSRYDVTGVAQTPSEVPFLFNEDNTIGAIDITLGDKSNTYNRARYNFYNPQKNWQFDTVYFDDESVRTNEDRGIVLEQSVRMDFVASRYCAQEIVRQNLRQSRQQIVVGFQTNISALANNVGDIVDITNENAGWELKQFRVLKMELQEDGNIKIVLVEYDAAVYNAAAQGLAFENDAPDTNLPNAFSTSQTPDTPFVEDANLTGKSTSGDEVQMGRVKVYFPQVSDPFIDYYELQYAALEQKGLEESQVVLASAYEIVTVASTDWSSINGPSAAVIGDVFESTGTDADISALGTVKVLTALSSGYSTLTIPSTQVDVSNNVVEYIENLSPTTGYAFRARFVRTNSVVSAYSTSQYFITAGISGNVGPAGTDGVSPTMVRLVSEHQRFPTKDVFDPAPAFFLGNSNYTGIHATYGNTTENYISGERVIVEVSNSSVSSVTRDGVWECSAADGCAYGSFVESEWTDTGLASNSVGELQYRIRAIMTTGNTDITNLSSNLFTWYKDNVPRFSGVGSAYSYVEIDASTGGLYGGIEDSGANVWEVRVDDAGGITSGTPSLANTQQFNVQLFTP
tara:strand:- start:940 stop:3822 length:2883 start_codon:yes stop_codon:yes gene_type:complete